MRPTACLLLDSPVEGVQREDTEFRVVITVCTITEEEFGKLGNMLAKERDFLYTRKKVRWKAKETQVHQKAYKNEERFEDIEKLSCTSLVGALNALTNYVDHSRKQILERFLEQK